MSICQAHRVQIKPCCQATARYGRLQHLLLCYRCGELDLLQQGSREVARAVGDLFHHGFDELGLMVPPAS